MPRNNSNQARDTKTSNASSKTAVEKDTKSSFSLWGFLGYLLTSVFYAVYGISTLLALKKGGLDKDIKAFDTQVLKANSINLDNAILLKINQALAFIFIGSPYLARSKFFKRSVLLAAFILLEWTTVVSLFGDIQKGVSTGNFQSLAITPACWEKCGAFLLTLGSLLL
jgi:hypothetical protein